MGLYSVSKYVQNMLNGLSWPTLPNTPDLIAYITPPNVDKASGPRAYVWGGRVHRSRQTGPRIAGMNKRPWTIDTYLIYVDTPADAMANEPFPQMIDTVINVYETATMPVWINSQGVVVAQNQGSATDTQIQAIGEEWDLQYPPERLPASLRMVAYTALVSVSVLEVKQG